MPPDRRTREAVRPLTPTTYPRIARTGLEYLDLWRQLFVLHVATFRPCEDDPSTVGRCDTPKAGADDDDLLEGLDRFETAYPSAPVVALARDREISAADLAILHALLIDAQNSEPGVEGFVIPTLARRACLGPNNTFALERLTPDAPIVRRGLALVRNPEAPFLQRVVDAAPELLRIAWADRGALPAAAETMGAAVVARASVWGDAHRSQSDTGGTVAEAVSVEPSVGAFVLPPAVERQFQQVVTAVREGQALRERFGFATTMPTARSSSVLFVGPPGTGKTTACRALAHALGKPLRLICAGDVLGKYVGESEKRLQREFSAADDTGSVLAIDEIDALAYARSSARMPFERALVTQLLVLLERYPNLVIAATSNEPGALDHALERRMAFRIEVPMPGPDERLRLWRELIPAALPIGPEVDLLRLAKDHELSGALVRDAVWHAALAMRTRGAEILAMNDLLDGLAAVQAGRWTATAQAEHVGFRINTP